jgi:rhamnose utilization protein RhaD (predicted bifunctional aldolase and dehydrogenase)/NAD(P)-dependent dehydrogenase (short-subunit alcohol dehydrogenase family)
VNLQEARASIVTELAAVCRSMGADRTLVLGGGGNASVKTVVTDITDATVPVLFVKASGHDLATITADGFAPLRLDRVRRLLPPVSVPADQLRNELRCALMDADATDPSVETLVHALLPDEVVLHSHADAVLALSNRVNGAAVVRELLGSLCVVVDYAMPGPDLVTACDSAWRGRRGDEVGLVVLGHGLFTVGATPEQAWQRHQQVCAAAEAARHRPAAAAEPLPAGDLKEIAAFRKALCDQVGHALVVRRSSDEQIAAFVADPAMLAATAAGPVTPDHVTWTKPFALIGRDLAGYRAAYDAYFVAQQTRTGAAVPMLDDTPRVILDPQWGMLTAGRTAHEAETTAEIYRHTMSIMTENVAQGGYQPAGLNHVFDLEYWSYQQQKLARIAQDAELVGQVALVTGAASGIGRGCTQALLDAGACVVGWDLSEKVLDAFDGPNYLGLQVDVTDPGAVAAALARQVEVFGGMDILVVAAGVFPTSANLGELTADAWRRTMSVNVDAVMELYGQSMPLLAAGFPYGRVVLIASKNVAAPGPGAAAYSSSKAAVTQLTRVAALEWASAGIRVNMIHPDAVFDTGLWTPELLAARAEHYGMSVDDYKRRNLLHTEITSADVGLLTRELCTASFACVTGAQVPIDGGNERVI